MKNFAGNGVLPFSFCLLTSTVAGFLDDRDKDRGLYG